jgi:aminoglycoside phosphotransferase family enzyme/predicted kinase
LLQALMFWTHDEDDLAPDRSTQGRLPKDVERWVLGGAGGPTRCDEVIETSISWLFLFRGRVLKFKKAVDFGFVDFTTLERRLWAARRELDFNRLTAPTLYRRLVAIGRTPSGDVAERPEDQALDIAVEMARFDQEAILARRLPLDGDFAESLGRRIGAIHLAAAPGLAGGGSAGLDYVMRSNAEQLARHPGGLMRDDVIALEAAATRAWESARDLLDERLASGFCRACHGDLHTQNIVLIHGEPVLFDCIEFSDRLREIDVLYDIAFLLMDLAFRGSLEAANRAFNGWLDATARGLDSSMWRGLAVLPLFQAVRATVRAHVSAREGKDEAAGAYLAAAARWLQPQGARLVAVGGLSGAGKTFHARRLAPALGAAPGAVVLRSDEIRKRLMGRSAHERLSQEAYRPEISAEVYATLERTAAACLAGGRSVIADAVFLSAESRRRIEEVADAAGAPFAGVWLEGRPDVLRRRLGERRGDASDADAAVLERQLAQDPGEITWARTPAGG